MSLSLLLLLLLLVFSSEASHFMGTVMTYYPKDTNADGSVTVVLRYKLGYHVSCKSDTWSCLSRNCGTEVSIQQNIIDSESDDWCQKEGISTRLVPNNTQFQPLLIGGSWVTTINNIVSWRAVTLVELRMRSDTSKANTSPQTTILPLVRYGNTSLSECNPCTPPSVLNLSSSCTLSFSPTSSSNEGVYAVQLVMEDFPTHTITLTQTNGAQEVKTNSDALSKIPVQFAFSVDPEVPSCTEGLYLPKFLPPTPDNRAQLYTPVNHSLEILIKAETKNTTISELLFSGPYNVTNTTLAAGEYILSWTPSQNEDGESHPICFVVQAISSSTVKYHSELRCVMVTVGNAPTTSPPPVVTPTVDTTSAVEQLRRVVVGMMIKISSSSPLSEDYIRNTIMQQLKDELIRRGLTSSSYITLLVSSETNTSRPGG
ncbi:uncharacterized protein LOC113157657 isoform X2 [Anabas testudineus]|uniref:uncharacterized protein LOC113157657 isoform X2 n=1 Tax=Anabas testudineus TaxID=64144 RepID=UPI000E45F73E|nr:uncharacterized protein LOC113157657 isoform X2 [Anabas testudineus]